MEDVVTVSIALQVALLSISVPLNAGILVVSVRRDLIQDNLKYFVANLAVLDIAVTIWLARFLLSYVNAPDNLVFLEIIYRCWLIYALLAIVMGLLPLTLFAVFAVYWPKKDGYLFSKTRCICYCYIVDLIPMASYILISNDCYTTWLCGMNTAMYSFLSIALVTIILINWKCYKTICGMLLMTRKTVEQSAKNCDSKCDSNSRHSECHSNSLSTAPQPLPSILSEKEELRLKEAKEIALVSFLQALKPAIIFFPRILNFFVNAVIVPLVDSGPIGRYEFLFYSNFFTNEIVTTFFCAQPCFDAIIILCLIRQYHETAVSLVERCVNILKKTSNECQKLSHINESEFTVF